MTKTATAPLPPRQRKKRASADLVQHLRARVWLAEVWARTDETLRGLDRKFLGKDSFRAFWRVHRNGYDPGRKRYSQGNKSLVEIVGGNSGYSDTIDLYNSPIWLEVLGPKPLKPKRRNDLIEMLFEKLELFQAKPKDAFIASNSGRPSTPKLMPCNKSKYQKSLNVLTECPRIDHILLLCLLYRKSLEAAFLEEAICLRDAIFRAVYRFCDRPGYEGRIRSLWDFLIQRRVIAGNPDITLSTEAVQYAEVMVSELRKKVKSAADAKNMTELELEFARGFDQGNSKMYGIYPRDATIRVYLETHDVLEEKARRNSMARTLREARKALKKHKFPDLSE